MLLRTEKYTEEKLAVPWLLSMFHSISQLSSILEPIVAWRFGLVKWSEKDHRPWLVGLCLFVCVYIYPHWLLTQYQLLFMEKAGVIPHFIIEKLHEKKTSRYQFYTWTTVNNTFTITNIKIMCVCMCTTHLQQTHGCQQAFWEAHLCDEGRKCN